MFKKVGLIIANFIKTSKICELFFVFGVPAIITLALLIFCHNDITEFKKFASGFNDTVITITALLSAFGLTSLSILATSSSKNVETAKCTVTKRLDMGKKYISYYKLQIMRNFFSLIIQFSVLILSIILKFIIETSINIKTYFYIEAFLLLASIFLQIFVVSSIYYLFVTPKKGE